VRAARTTHHVLWRSSSNNYYPSGRRCSHTLFARGRQHIVAVRRPRANRTKAHYYACGHMCQDLTFWIGAPCVRAARQTRHVLAVQFQQLLSKSGLAQCILPNTLVFWGIVSTNLKPAAIHTGECRARVDPDGDARTRCSRAAGNTLSQFDGLVGDHN
jgi:hypothetical protein